MRIIIFAGKGGVGKTISAASLALFLADQGENTIIIDYDKGHRVARTLGLEYFIPDNEILQVYPNLSVVIIESPEYINITRSKEKGIRLDRYLSQFPEDTGIVPLPDMMFEFWGAPFDIPEIHKFTLLVRTLSTLGGKNFANVIIDVEPTAGLERLLLKADVMVKSLANLRSKGILLLTMMGTGRWPDVTGYIKSDYIRQSSKYAKNIELAMALLKNAFYFIVCIPESGPVEQAFEIKEIIERFGGKIYGVVVNNIRGEESEAHNIRLLQDMHHPMKFVHRKSEIHIPHVSTEVLTQILRKIGKTLYPLFGQDS